MADEALLGISEAARRLGLHKSVLSRYVAANPDLNHALAGPPKVVISEVQAHREQTVNPAKAGNHAGMMQDEYEEAKSRPSGRAAVPGLSTARTAHESIKARIAQMDLDERLGRTCARADVEEAGEAAARELVEALETRRHEMAECLAAMSDPRDVLAYLEAEDAEMLRRMTDAADRALSGTDGNEEDSA